MAKRSKRSRRKDAESVTSRQLDYEKYFGRVHAIVRIRDRRGEHNFRFVQTERGWNRVIKRERPVMRRERRRFMVHTQTHTNKHPVRMHRDFAGMVYDQPTDERRVDVFKVHYSQAEFVAFLKRYDLHV